MQEYKTIKEVCSAEIEIKRSKFIATISPCKTENEATDFINGVKKKYWDAKHNVYAFVIRENGIKRFSDDGEPHSTAGLPIMETVEHFGVTDVAVVVTRYFGGILLGTGGLVRAYSDAASEVLKKAETVTVLPAKQFEIYIEYGDYDILLKILTESGAQITNTDFAENVTVFAAIPAKNFNGLEEKITDKFCGRVGFNKIEETFLGFK